MRTLLKGATLSVLLLAGGCLGALQASTLYTAIPASGSVNLDVFSGGGFDINGQGAFESATYPVDPVLIIGPAFLTHPANTLLFATTLSASQFASAVFDLTNATASGSNLLVPGLVSGIASPDCAGGTFAGCQPLTDPALAGLLGVVQFQFALASSSDNGTRFELKSITAPGAVPEPGTAGLLSLGAVAIALGRLRRPKARQQ